TQLLNYSITQLPNYPITQLPDSSIAYGSSSISHGDDGVAGARGTFGRSVCPARSSARCRWLGRRAASSFAADGQRHGDPHQGVVPSSADRGAKSPGGHDDRSRSDERHGRGTLAVSDGRLATESIVPSEFDSVERPGIV